LSAEIVWLFEQDAEQDDLAIDLRTAVDVAIRDLQEILDNWGTELARERAVQCHEVLVRALAAA